MSPNYDVIRFFMAFQTHDLCGFRKRTFYSLVLESFADSKLLDFSDTGQLTFRINRTLGVSWYIRHRPNSYTHVRGLQGRSQGVSWAVKRSVQGSKTATYPQRRQNSSPCTETKQGTMLYSSVQLRDLPFHAMPWRPS